MKRISTAGLAFMCFAVAGCDQQQAEKAAPEPSTVAPPQPRHVEAARARKVPLGEQVVISGTLAAQDEVTVKSKVGGRLASISVDLGSIVESGQQIAQIEQVDYRLRVAQAQAMLGQAKASLGLSPSDRRSEIEVDEATAVRAAQATLEEARANFERSKTLLEKRLIGRADFDSANATLLRAESEVQRAREDVYQRLAVLKQREVELSLARQQLSDTSIRSPLDGVVQVRRASAGELLAAGADVATVVRIDPLRLRVEVPEREAARIAVGQVLHVRVDDSDRVYAGRVARLSPVLDAQSRTLVVEGEIPNRGELTPGSFARARIELGEGEPVLAIPRSALVVFAGIEKVIGIDDGRAVEKPIKTGRTAGELVEVLEGLSAGELVVLEPGSLQHGEPVVVAGEVETPSSASIGARRRDSRVE